MAWLSDSDPFYEARRALDEFGAHQGEGSELLRESDDLLVRLADWDREDLAMRKRVARSEVALRGSRFHQTVLDFMKEAGIELEPGGQEQSPVQEEVSSAPSRPAGKPPARPGKPPPIQAGSGRRARP